jgi:hypothetical protein
MRRGILSTTLALFLLPACFSRSDAGPEPKHDGDTEVDATDDADAELDADHEDADAELDAEADAQVPDPRHPVTRCGALAYECGDGLDNDDDGRIDSDDPDCMGPCDNNESGYFAALPGADGDRSACQFDCYFDADSASGSVDCTWDVRCDPLSPGGAWGGSSCAYDPTFTGLDCASHFEAQYETRAGCQENCEFRVPNGCDCFGCCSFPSSTNADRHLLLGSRVPGTTNQYECTHAEAVKDDTALCAECTPVPSCYKACGRCELCLGKLSVPDDCTSEELAARCGDDAQVCGLPGEDPCAEHFYCLSGCCVQFEPAF